MGFADTMAGLGRGLLAGLESVVGQVAPAFVQAGSQFLIQKAFPGASASLFPGTFSPAGQFFGDRSRAPFPGELPFNVRSQAFPQLGPGSGVALPTGGIRTPVGVSAGIPRQVPNIFQDVPFAQTFTDLIRAGVPPTLPAIFPTGIFAPPTQPGGFQAMPPFVSSKLEAGGGVLALPSTAGFAGGCPSLFSAGGMSARPISMFMVPNPVTGKPTFFKHAGRPILFSGDLRACKTVNRIAARARRVRGRR